MVGFPAGGPSDVPARIIAEKLRVALGQPVIVENKTGAAGMIALNDVLAQPRDGHTLLLCSYIDAINPLLYKKVAYKLDDIAPVSLIQKAYYAFTISNELPVNDLKGFIAHAKTKPGALNYGKVGSGSVTELLARQLEKVAGISMTGVTFRGTGPAVQEIAAGRLDFMVGPLAVTIPLHEAKKVKIIGMTSPERLAGRARRADPEGAGHRHRELRLVGRVRGGRARRSRSSRRLNKHIAAAVASAEFKSVIEKTGVIPLSSSVDEFAAIIADTAKEAGVMIKELGIEQLD